MIMLIISLNILLEQNINKEKQGNKRINTTKQFKLEIILIA
jgi:hypothetical protein